GTASLLPLALILYFFHATLPAVVARVLPGINNVGVTLPVLSFTFALALISTGVCMVPPLLRLVSIDLRATLYQHLMGIAYRRLRRTIVIVEVALAVTASLSVMLMWRSFAGLGRFKPGFDSHGLALVDVTLRPEKYPRPEQRAAFVSALESRVRETTDATA